MRTLGKLRMDCVRHPRPHMVSSRTIRPSQNIFVHQPRAIDQCLAILKAFHDRFAALGSLDAVVAEYRGSPGVRCPLAAPFDELFFPPDPTRIPVTML
jgi:hypothetical protein